MPKPLITASFLSFPKLLLWCLPLIFLLIYTWLVGALVPANLWRWVQFQEKVIVSQIFSSKPVLHDSAFIPDFTLSVTEQQFTQSCITKRGVVLVNGTSPGPEIRLVEGNVYWIRVFNDMDSQNLTMHWHGLSMSVSPFSDGTPAASQWPIPPNHYFDYEMEITKGMAGTYFYHSHIGFQAVTAAGPLIVDEAGSPPYTYDEERTIALADVFEKTDKDIERGLLANQFVWSGETVNLLVNGKGQLPGEEESSSCEIASIDVEVDKTYRFRFIGGTALSFVMLAFEDHDQMTLIEADGEYTKPVNISYLQIGSGQRFSVLFKTKSRKELTENQFFLQLETRDRPKLTRSFAVLNYKTTNSKRIPVVAPRLTLPTGEPPLVLPPTNIGWLDHKLEALFPSDAFPHASEVTRRITIRTHQIIGNGSITWAQDKSPWVETFPAEPYLVSLYRADGMEFPSLERALANGGIDPVTRVFPAQIGEVIEIIIQNTGSDVGSLDVHPFHAHGAHYYDLGSGTGTYDADENEKKLVGVQLARRDTTMLYKYGETTTPGVDMGWRAWRLRVIEPGVWMVHCHILQHMIMGMQTVWIMGNETEILKVPVKNVQGYLDYGGSVYGNFTHDPSLVHFKGPLPVGKLPA